MEIVSICKGLPLVLVASGKNMATKHTVEEWDEAVKAMQRGHHRLDWCDTLFKAVEASYDSLPNDNIRRCFLCCSWWPEDCNIPSKQLIDCWVGLGLIDGFQHMAEAYIMGYHIIRSLLEASLLEAGDDEDGEVRMHGLIRDVALRIAPEIFTDIVREWIIPAGDGEGLKLGWKGAVPAEMISLMTEDIQSLAHDQPISPKLKTLILRNNHLKEITPGLLHSMTALTYLDLSYTSIKELPEEVAKLMGLQYLNLSHTPISSMPWVFGNLVRLRYLHLSYTPNLKHLSLYGRAMLENLRLLDMFRSGFTNWASKYSLFSHLDIVGSKSEGPCSSLMVLGITVESITVLVQLSTHSAYSLVSRLSITKLKEVTRLELSPNLFRNLQELCIEDCTNLEELIILEDEHTKDEKYLRLSSLAALQLHRLTRLNEIIWKGAEFLRGVHSLEIDGCSMLENITWASKLPFLDKLTLSNCERMKQVIEIETVEDDSIKETIKEEYDRALSSIKYLLLRSLPNLYAICNSMEKFPYLRSGMIDNCPKLKLSLDLQSLIHQKKVTLKVDDPDMSGFLRAVGSTSVSEKQESSENQEDRICIDNFGNDIGAEEAAVDFPSSSAFYGISDGDDPLKAMQIDDQAIEAFKVCFDSLPDDNMRRCFLCCSWWPEDCNIPEKELIDCWVGLGLIDSFKDMVEAYLMGYRIIRSLLETSLLEAGDDEDGEVRMHGMIRGAALRIAPKTLTKVVREWIIPEGARERLKVGWKGAESAEVISLMNEDIRSLVHDQPFFPELKTLILRNNPLNKIPGGLLLSMTALTYLDLSYTSIEELPGEVCTLTGMQYLNLSHTPISSLPWEFGKLVSLRYLHLSCMPYLGGFIIHNEILKLVNLRLLDMFRSGSISRQSRYELLDIVDQESKVFGSSMMVLGITVKDEYLLRELSTRSAYSLVSRLSISNNEQEDRIRLSPILLRNVQELCIENCTKLEEMILLEEHIKDEKHLHLSRLTALQLLRLKRLKKIIWIGAEFLRGLHTLEIDRCNMLENITWASKLPFLRKLTLSNCRRMEQVIEDYGGDLSSIKYLVLRNLPKLYAICNSWEEFPCLRSGLIDNCPKLKLSPDLQNLVHQKKVTVKRVDDTDMTGFLPVLRSGSYSRDRKFSIICLDNLVNHPGAGAEAELPASTAFYGVSDAHFEPRDILASVLENAYLPCSVREALRDAFTLSLERANNVITALIYGRTMLVASAGKCRSVLCKRGLAIELVESKKYSTPFNLREETVTEEDEFLIMTTSDLLYAISSQDAVTIARKELMLHNDPQRCSEMLASKMYTRYVDDRLPVSMVVVCFSPHPPPPIEHDY